MSHRQWLNLDNGARIDLHTLGDKSQVEHRSATGDRTNITAAVSTQLRALSDGDTPEEAIEAMLGDALHDPERED